ncbi:MAG: nucleotidyl transferase AbiEii/AbiGii toxin family protein [Elusimicrobia bacterium]|nr:nucleotidyl transferase AbiEii/AbiGii toxin family protein [Elusimicrobiota bacterium]
MDWHPEALSPEAEKVARSLGRIEALAKFYLAGGTGLALRCGHRISLDLDLFSADFPPGEDGTRPLKDALSHLEGFRVREERDGTLHAVIRGVETSLLRYRYPLLRPASRWEGLAVAQPEDIGLMKIGAVIGRGSRKDFRDLREICRSARLRDLLSLAGEKFPDAEDFLFQASKALVFFEDAQREPEPVLLRPEPWRSVRRFFEAEVPAVFRGLRL